MPPYINSAFPHAIGRVQPQPFYCYGYFDSKQTPTKLQITGVAVLATNVATIFVTLISGPVPVVGATMGVRATTTNPTVFNLDPVTVTAVSINSAGVGTISYATTSVTIAQVADSGEASVLPYETPDALAVGASVPVALTFDTAESDGSRCVSAQCSFPTIPTSCTVVLQVADVDQNNRYYTVGNVATIAGGVVTQQGAQFSFVMGRFMRLAVTQLTGTGSIIGTLFV
jgi:hypothetical protein